MMPASVSALTLTTWSISVGATMTMLLATQTSGVADPTTTHGTIGRGPKHGTGAPGSRVMLK
eukprot:2191568-Lingulodinium_polyedra.AAC.1